MRTLSAKEFNHKEHKETISVTLAAEASKNHENATAAPTHWIAAVSAATKTSRKVREVRKGMENNWDIFSFYLLFSLNRLKMLDNYKFLCYT